MRLFYREFYNEFVDSTDERFTLAADNALLASAETLVIQVRAFKISGTSPTLTVRIYRSNDGTDWSPGVIIQGPDALTAGTVYFAVTGSNASIALMPAAQARISVQLGGTAPAAQVEFVVCGRGQSLRQLAPASYLTAP